MTTKSFIEVNVILKELWTMRKGYLEEMLQDEWSADKFKIAYRNEQEIQKVIDFVLTAPWDIHETED